ncbi:hypothetical protein PWT90_08842 [Aphanocladium album]|nr:hypothetical protein PWT90_08842 [Aphanocladium album]
MSSASDWATEGKPPKPKASSAVPPAARRGIVVAIVRPQVSLVLRPAQISLTSRLPIPQPIFSISILPHLFSSSFHYISNLIPFFSSLLLADNCFVALATRNQLYLAALGFCLRFLGHPGPRRACSQAQPADVHIIPPAAEARTQTRLAALALAHTDAAPAPNRL